MERLTGLDADGNIISTEEYSVIGTRGLTDEENKNIVEHLLTKLYELENKEEELEDLTEHDKGFKDEIKRLKESIKERDSCIKQFKHDAAKIIGELERGRENEPCCKCGIRNEAEVRSERECLEQIVSFIRSDIDTLQLLISAIKDINTKIDRLANEIKSL